MRTTDFQRHDGGRNAHSCVKFDQEPRSEVFLDPCTGEICVPGDQAAIWIHQDLLPQVDEECCLGEHAGRPGQSVPAGQAAAVYVKRERIRSSYPRRRAMKQKQGEFGNKMPPENELPGILVQKTNSCTGKSQSR